MCTATHPAPPLQNVFDLSFEYVHSSGMLMDRCQLTEWFHTEGHACCAGSGSATAADSEAGDKAGEEAGGNGRLYMWVDRYKEFQVAHGRWLARWMELYQPFEGGCAASGCSVQPAGQGSRRGVCLLAALSSGARHGRVCLLLRLGWGTLSGFVSLTCPAWRAGASLTGADAGWCRWHWVEDALHAYFRRPPPCSGQAHRGQAHGQVGQRRGGGGGGGKAVSLRAPAREHSAAGAGARLRSVRPLLDTPTAALAPDRCLPSSGSCCVCEQHTFASVFWRGGVSPCVVYHFAAPELACFSIAPPITLHL